ncbi:heavy-metal-associated domain-containing protein [Natronobiforma cellulositropha]|uniref:heavy-metal-associated domain-containing protein n=1 Tax=Natronobiforma cellulositropha TaxID=1679076 RepID=UPI0021D5F746|nr:heavy-metal-associated domain-containing protein [Natronobiforma cellulositropha]
MDETTLSVGGMACGGCEETVTDALEALSGVSSASASHESGMVRVSHDESTVDAETLETTVEDAGYEVVV